jgi:hypothetical protein
MSGGPLSARRTTNQRRESPSHKNFGADQEMPDRTKGYFERNLSLETLRATIGRTIRMACVSDETAQCFRNEPLVD